MAAQAKLLAFYYLLQKRKRQRTTLVSNINLLRPEKGEYHTLMPDLRADPKSFFNYFRMDQAHFDDLLEKVTPLIAQGESNWRPNIIQAEERLAVTLR